MNWALIGIFSFLLLFGTPIFAIIIAFAILGASLLPGAHSILPQLVGDVHALTSEREIIDVATIPFFTYAGYLLAEAKSAQRLLRVSNAALGWAPGGLAIVTVLACAFFTTFTGASGVTIIAVGALLYPALIKDGYKEKFSLGLVTGSGSIGLLFPPSLPLIVYGIVYALSTSAFDPSVTKVRQLDISRFLLAGIPGGLVLVIIVCAFAVVVAVSQKVPRMGLRLRETFVALWDMKWELPIPILVIGMLMTGYQAPDAAAITALYVLVIEVFVYRDIPIRKIPKITREAMVLVGAIFIKIVSATVLTSYFVAGSVPQHLYELMHAHVTTPVGFLFVVNGLLLIVGCMMDVFSAILVVVPLIGPAAVHYHIDPYQLGVVFLVNLEIGYLATPVGLNVLISSFRFERPLAQVYKSALPIVALMLVALGVVTYVPKLTELAAPVNKIDCQSMYPSGTGAPPGTECSSYIGPPPPDAGAAAIKAMQQTQGQTNNLMNELEEDESDAGPPDAGARARAPAKAGKRAAPASAPAPAHPR